MYILIDISEQLNFQLKHNILFKLKEKFIVMYSLLNTVKRIY